MRSAWRSRQARTSLSEKSDDASVLEGGRQLDELARCPKGGSSDYRLRSVSRSRARCSFIHASLMLPKSARVWRCARHARQTRDAR